MPCHCPATHLCRASSVPHALNSAYGNHPRPLLLEELLSTVDLGSYCQKCINCMTYLCKLCLRRAPALGCACARRQVVTVCVGRCAEGRPVRACTSKLTGPVHVGVTQCLGGPAGGGWNSAGEHATCHHFRGSCGCASGSACMSAQHAPLHCHVVAHLVAHAYQHNMHRLACIDSAFKRRNGRACRRRCCTAAAQKSSKETASS